MDNQNKPKRKDIIIAALTSVVITGALAFSYIQSNAAEVSESATPNYTISTSIESDSQSNSEESVYIYVRGRTHRSITDAQTAEDSTIAKAE